MNPSFRINRLMNPLFRALLFGTFTLSTSLASPSALAQLYSADKGRVIYGHHHINTQNLDPKSASGRKV